MTDKAELPDEIWASTLVVTDDDPNMVMGFWGPRRFKDGVRYILADIADELRKSRDHHASTIFIQEGRIASQASEIAALKAKLAHYTYKTDPYAPENKHQLDDMAEHIIAQAAEIAALKNDLDRLTRGTWSLEIARRSLMTADLRAELAAAKEALREQLQKAQSALQMTSDWFAAAQAEAELYLIPNNDCNQYWFVSRMLWHLDGPTQRALKAAIDAAMEEPKP